MKIEVMVGDVSWTHESDNYITHQIAENGVLTIYDYSSRPFLGQHYLNMVKVFRHWDNLEYVR